MILKTYLVILEKLGTQTKAIIFFGIKFVIQLNIHLNSKIRRQPINQLEIGEWPLTSCRPGPSGRSPGSFGVPASLPLWHAPSASPPSLATASFTGQATALPHLAHPGQQHSVCSPHCCRSIQHPSLMEVTSSPLCRGEGVQAISQTAS